MHDDSVTEAIRNDELIIKYANHLTIKYMRHKHLTNFIRQRLRQIAKFLIQVKSENPKISNLIDVIHPNKIDCTLVAINNVAGLDLNAGSYAIPSLATTVGTVLKQCAHLLIVEAIKKDDVTLQTTVKIFIKVFNLEFNNAISKLALANLSETKWNKQEILPLASDVLKLYNFLKTQCANLYSQLCDHYNYDVWANLSKYTMLTVMLFNRRRVGETERLLIANYNMKHTIDKTSDIYKSLSPVEQALCDRYYRVQLRGKLGRGVPVLLSPDNILYIDKMFEFREQAGVSMNNSYVFGRRETFFEACKSLREVATLCGAEHPEFITGTKLRKQIATVVQLLNLNDSEIKHLATFMGHDKKIHECYYRLPNDAIHLGKISKLLLLLETGNISSQKGKNLDNIDGFQCLGDENVTESSNSENIGGLQNFLGDYNIGESSNSGNTSGKLSVVGEKLFCTEESKNGKIFNAKKGQPNVKRRLFPNDDPHVAIKQRRLPQEFPRGHIKRNTWSTPEKRVVRRRFENNFTGNYLPSLEECMRAIAEEKDLKHRTACQVKAWINNQIRKRMSNFVA